MKYLPDGKQMKSCDQYTIQHLGIPSLALMERAAKACVEVIKEAGFDLGATLIVCGGGNNGGDGLAMARGLHVLGIGCEVALLKPAEGLAGDARDNYALLRELPVAIHEIHANAGVLADLSGKADLIVDALLGTGFKGRLSEPFHVAIDSLNRSGKPILAVDIPSGLDGDSGAVADLAVTAERTITFAAIKIGLGQGDGPSRSGRIYIGDIGAPAETLIAGEDPANR